MSRKDHRTSKKEKNHYVISPAGVYVWLERGHSGGRPHAHEKSLLRCHFPQQPRHPVRLPRHERQPAVALQKGMTDEAEIRVGAFGVVTCNVCVVSSFSEPFCFPLTVQNSKIANVIASE